MSYTKEDPEPKVLEFHKNKIVWSVILFSLSGILLHFFPLKLDFNWPSFPSRPVTAPTSPSGPSELLNSPSKSYVVRLELDEVKWSEWVTVPPGYQFRVSRPGCWADFLFWDGRQVHLGPDDHVWFKDLSDGNFKLRGTKGLTEVFIEPK